MPEELRVYTDGACIRNPGPGGYAGVVLRGEEQRIVRGGEAMTTNNRMEIRAAVESLLLLDGMPGTAGARVLLYSDSRYLTDAFNKGWIDKWRSRGWRRKKNAPVKNLDLWTSLLGAMGGRDVSCLWIRGHGGHTLNILCDRIANEEARKAAGGPDAAGARRAKPTLFWGED